MRLWTWHKPAFSLLEGRVDHERSEYVQTVFGVRDAYHQLARHLGTDQLIWCYTLPDQRIVLPVHSEVEWVLDVPDDMILRFADDIVWNRILGIRCALPRDLEHRWKDEAIRAQPHDPDAQHKLIAERRDAFWNQPPAPDGWWSRLFVPMRAAKHVSALIRHPVRSTWVIQGPRTGSM